MARYRFASIATAIACLHLPTIGGTQAAVASPNDTTNDATIQKQWRAVLHYRKSRGRWVSEVGEGAFFLDRQGRTNPKLEWKASWAAFLRPPETTLDDHAQCRFPARFAVMRPALEKAGAEIPAIECPALKAFVQQVPTKSLSVAFASHYLGNPASAFGHTMLYLGSSSTKAQMLTEPTVSFEADTQGMGPMHYIPKGLLGGLRAQFRVIPFHKRVRKYERNELRDIWIFPLRATREDRRRLVLHLWELRELWFDYGFFSRNCAYKLLALVHAVAPRFDLLPIQSIGILPQEVVRRFVKSIGLAGKSRFRPSLASQFDAHYEALSVSQREAFETIVATRSVPPPNAVAVLRAALIWSEITAPYRAFRRATEETEHPDTVWRRALWQALSAAKKSPATPKMPAKTGSLLDAHSPSQLHIRSGFRGSDAVVGIGARWLLHNPMDPHDGYPAFSGLEVAKIDAEWTSDDKVRLQEATFLAIEQITPATRLGSPWAWRLELGARRLNQQDLHLGLELNLGVTLGRVHAQYAWTLYSLFGFRPGLDLTGNISFDIPAIAAAGLILRLPLGFRSKIQLDYSGPMFNASRRAAALNIVVRKRITRNLDLQFGTSLRDTDSSGTAGLLWFH